MTIAPISSVEVNTHRNVSFGHRMGDDEVKNDYKAPKKAGNLVKVPVIVMMAMTPSLLNGAMPVSAADNNNGEVTELLAMASPEPQRTSRSQRSNTVSSHIKPERVRAQKSFMSDGKRYTMYCMDESIDGNSKYVSTVYFVPDDYKQVLDDFGEDVNQPPRLRGFVYHDLGEGKEFVGAKVEEWNCNGRKSYHDTYKYEIKLDPDVANFLADLAHNRLTDIKVGARSSLAKMFDNIEVSTSPNVMPMIIEENKLKHLSK